MHAKALAVLVFVSVASATAAPKITGDNEVKPGGFAILTIDAKASVAWDVYPEPIQYAEIAGVVVFTGQPGIRYLAVATVIDFEAKTFTKVRHWVVFSGGPLPVPPGPTPVPPGPTPPAPVDPLALAIRDAAAKDGFTKLAALAGGFRALDAAVDSRDTGGEIKEASRAILAKSLGLEPGKPIKAPSLFAVLSAELTPLDALFPSDTTPATPERKQAAKAIFAKLALACDGASK